MSDHVSMISLNSVFLLPVLSVTVHSSSFTVSTSMLPKRVDNLRQFLGGLVSADLGNVFLELGEDLDLGGTHVWGNSELGVQQCLSSGTRVSSHVSVPEKSVVGSDLNDIWVLNLLAVLVLRVTVLVARMVLTTFLTLVLLVTSTSTSFLVV